MSATAGTAYVDIKPDWSGLNREIAKHGPVAAKAFSNQFGKALGPVMSQQARHIETAWRGVKIGAIAGGAAAAYAFKDIVEKGAAFEKQMSVNAAVSEANRKQLALLEKQSIKLGKATFYSAGEAAEAQAELIKGGLSLQKVLGGGLPAALNLAEAGQLGLATAAETTVNAMKLFRLSGKEAGSVADMLATAANRTTADVEDFAMALKQGGSVTKLAGYDMNETVTVLEALAEAGIKNADAGTSMKTAVIHLLKPSEKQAKMMKELGIQVVAQNGHLKDAAGLSNEFAKATDGMTKAERAKVFATIAGTDGIRTLNALYEEGASKLRGLEKANEKQGTAQEVAAKKMDNFAGRWEQFKGSLETTEIQIYKGIAPALDTLAEEGERAANKVGDIFSNENLDTGEKLERIVDFGAEELSKLWEKADIPEHAAEAFAAAAPVVAEAAAHTAVFAAEEFGKAFIHAPFIAKVAMGAWLVNFIGGKQAFVGIGKMYGRKLGLSLGEEAARTAAPVIAAETVAAMASPSVVAAQSRAAAKAAESTRSVWLASAPSFAPNLPAAAKGSLAHQMEGFALPGAFGAAGMFPDLEREMAARGTAAGAAVKTGMITRLKAATPEITASIAGMGSRVASGVTTWGLGGLVVGELSKEIVGGDAGQQIGDALQGAGFGAAIGSAIAPGLGTALGAALGGMGGIILGGLGDDAGDKAAEDFLRAFQRRAPEMQKMLGRFDLGREGHESVKRWSGPEALEMFRLGTAPPGTAFGDGGQAAIKRTITAGSGLRGVRQELRGEREEIEALGGSAKSIEALQQQLKLVNHAIAAGQKEITTYNRGFDLLKSGFITRMGDISKITQENIAHINQVWKNNPPKWHQAMAESMKASIAAIRAGMKQGVIDTETGQKRIKALTRNLRLFEGNDPLGLAKGFSESWAKAGTVNERAISQEIGQLKKMPKGAREAAREAMVHMAKTMESEGKLVKGSAARLNSALTTKFGQTNQQIQQSTAKAMSHIAQSVAEGATNVGGALSSIFDNLANALTAVGASKVPTFSLSTLSMASQYHHAREATQSGGGHPPTKRQQGGPIPGTFTVPGTGSGDTVPMMLPAGSFIENREAARLPFQTGGLTPVILEPKERVWLPPAVERVGLGNLHARNQMFPRFQTGGLMSGNLPHPGLKGPQPMQDLGQRAIDMAWKPAQKYLRAHMEPQRVLKMLHAGEAITSKGFPYVYGGGHGSFGIQPVDCSGLVSYVLHAGNFISSPMSVQQGSGLYTLGKSGPGKWFTWGVRGTSGANAHTMISVKAPGNKWKFFESGGSGGGAHQLGGWDGSFQFRHIPGYQRGGQVGMPKKAQEAVAKYGQAAFDPHNKHFVGWGYQRGGLIPAIQKFAKGGWAKVGATIDPEYGNPAFSDHGGMSFAELLQAGANRGLKGQSLTATLGIGPPHYTAEGQDYGMAMGTPIHVKMPGAAKQFVMYKNDVGSGQGGDPHYKVDLHSNIAAALGWSNNADIEVSTTGKHESAKEEKEHSFKEDVPAVYEGCKTGDMNLPSSTPKSKQGIEKELGERRREVGKYRAAMNKASKEKRPAVAQALQHNITNLHNRIAELTRALQKARFEAAKKSFSKRLGRFGMAKIEGYESRIEGMQRAYETANQFAEQVVDLEPVMPEQPQLAPLPAGATEKQREQQREEADKRQRDAEKAYVEQFSSYVNGPERDAFQKVLASEADWRNTILRAEIWGYSGKEPSVQYMERDWEHKIRLTDHVIDAINAYTEKVAADIKKWRSDPDHKGQDLPKWLQQEVARRDAERDRLPMLRFEDREYRKALGEGREKFFGGGDPDKLIKPPPFPRPGTGSLEEALGDVQGIHWPDLHELLPASALAPPRVAGRFGGAIWETQGAIEELGLKISQAANGIQAEEPSTSSEPAEEDSARLQALEEIALAANQEKLVRQIEAKVFGEQDRYRFQFGGLLDPNALPKYHSGGVIRPTAPGQREVPIMAKADERIRTPEQEIELAEAIRAIGSPTAGGPHVEVNINERTGEVKVKVDDQEIEAVVNRMQQRGARSAGRRRMAVPR